MADALLPVDRSSEFNPDKFLDAKGFVTKWQSGLAGKVDVIDTSKLRLERGMYQHPGQRLYKAERLSWLQCRGLIVPDGHIIAALKTRPDVLTDLWTRSFKSRPDTIHFDGITLYSTWDGRDFEIYAHFNTLKEFWEFQLYLGPWPSEHPSLVIDP